MKTMVHSTCALTLIVVQLLCARTPVQQRRSSPHAHTHGVMIFLNDDERDCCNSLSADAIIGLLSQAGPMVISTSLLANLKQTGALRRHDPAEAVERYNRLTDSDEDDVVRRELLLSAFSLEREIENWVIKQITPLLCLLLPKKYLRAQRISVADVADVTQHTKLTATELQLGFKVNHMPNLSINQLAMPEDRHTYTDYFVDALHPLFVTNHEYQKELIAHAPAWAIYIVGHAEINRSIVDMSFAAFTKFLAFLKDAIATKLLLYVSCYSGGIHHDYIYNREQHNTPAIYPFTIILQGLTDGNSFGPVMHPYVEHGTLKFRAPTMFNYFFDALTTEIDYCKIVAAFMPHKVSLGSLAQVRWPGKDRFEVLDAHKVLCITDALLAQEPIIKITNDATAEKDAPIGILLYTQSIQAELQISSRNMPGFVSMIPGSALHCIQKISSTKHDIPMILHSFTAAEGLPLRKLFVINELSAPYEKKMVSCTDVLVDYNEKTLQIYLTMDNTPYELVKTKLIKLRDTGKRARYEQLIKRCNASADADEMQEKNVTAVCAQFERPVTATQARALLQHLVDIMQSQHMVYIPTITSRSDQSADAWYKLLFELEDYTSPLGTEKTLWIGSIKLDNKVLYTNVIIDKTVYGWFKILYTEIYDDKEHYVCLHQRTWSELPEAHVEEYKKKIPQSLRTDT